MKKLLSLILVGAMTFALVACGSSSSTTQQSAAEPASSTEAEAGDTAAETTSTEPEASAEDLGTELVLYSSMTESDLDALLTCFNEVYPDINVEVVNGSAGELTARIRGEASNPVGDVVWGGMANSDGDVNADIYEAWLSPYDAENGDGFQSTNGLYSMDHLTTVVFCINKKLEEELGFEIKSYEDLIRPELKGKIVFSDPNSSSAAWNNLSNIMSVYGNDTEESWAYIEQLIPNLVVAGSSSACFKNVDQGEYVVGLTYEDGAVKLLQDGSENIRLQYPEEGTSATVMGTALIKGAPHEAAAKAMINFICSAEGQTAMAAYMQGTLRFTNKNYEVPADAWLLPTSDIKWVERDVEYLTANKEAILEHWNELMGKVGTN